MRLFGARKELAHWIPSALESVRPAECLADCLTVCVKSMSNACGTHSETVLKLSVALQNRAPCNTALLSQNKFVKALYFKSC
jgi:hypothetical protein